MKKQLLTLLTTTLALGAPVTTTQGDALDAWADKYLPVLKDMAAALLTPPFNILEVQELAEEAVLAADELRDVFKGVPRAKIAQAVLSVAARAACPDGLEPWVMPLIEGSGAEAMIESAFRKLFPERAAQAAPVVDASDVDAGGVQ